MRRVRELKRKKPCTCSGDREDLIKKRSKHYNEETYPLVNQYQKKGCYYQGHGMRPIAEVTREILAIVDGKEILSSVTKGGKKSLA